MSQDQSLQLIRKAFAHVDVERIVIEFDPLVAADITKIYVREDQLDAAMGEDGYYPRQVAIDSGMNIEVVLSKNKKSLE